MSAQTYRGRPRFHSVQVSGGFEDRWQTPVYATATEARVSGSGWLYWSDPEAGDWPDLTTDEARALARLFIASTTDCEGVTDQRCQRCTSAASEHLASCFLGRAAVARRASLTTADRERLSVWVRDYLRPLSPLEWVECEKSEKSSWVAEELGISEDDARALCEAAGWPS